MCAHTLALGLLACVLLAACDKPSGPDLLPPPPVVDLQVVADPAGNALQLAWTLPAENDDLAGVRIVSQVGTAPADPASATVVCDSDPASSESLCDGPTAHLDLGLADGLEVHYAAYAHDRVPNSAEPARAAGVPADSTSPDPVRALTAMDLGTGALALVTLEPPLHTADLAGVLVLRREDAAPQGPNDPQATLIYEGVVQSVHFDSGVALGHSYTYAAYAFDEVPNHSVAVTAQVHIGTYPVTDFIVTDPGLGKRLELSWVNPADGAADQLRILRFVGDCALEPDPVAFDQRVDLVALGAGQPQDWTDDGVLDGVEYCYAAFARAGSTYSPGAFATGSCLDVTPPQAVTGLAVLPSATSGDRAMDLGWTNPPDADLARVLILRRVGAAPDDPQDARAVVVYDGLEQGCRDLTVEDGVAYHYRAWAMDGAANRSEPADAQAERLVLDDDGDGFREDQGDCDDDQQWVWPGATSLDCSETDWNCDGAGWDDAFCQATAPAWLEPQCTAAAPPYLCLEGVGCEWYELPDHTPCALTTDPDFAYDICVAGGCRSPGTCDVAGCNSPGPHFPLAPAIGHTNFTRTADAEPLVTDGTTGLVWQGCAAGLSGAGCTSGTAQNHIWWDALAYCDALVYAGYDDWHLPDRYELLSIVDYGRILPAIDPAVFPETSNYYFWSSSTYSAGSIIAWQVFFGSGNMGYMTKDYPYLVRCVRGGP